MTVLGGDPIARDREDGFLGHTVASVPFRIRLPFILHQVTRPVNGKELGRSAGRAPRAWNSRRPTLGLTIPKAEVL